MAEDVGRQERYAFRRELVDAVVADLVGPAGEVDETLSDPPITRYIVGVLYPRDAGAVDPAEAHDEIIETEGDAAPDPAVSWSNVRYPSSCGLTFAVDSNAASAIRVVVEAARYSPSAAEALVSEDVRSVERPYAAQGNDCWCRSAVESAPITIDVATPDEGRKRRPLADGLELFCRVRRADATGVVSVTLVLMNVNVAGKTRLRDELAFFQSRICVEAPDAVARPFAARENSAIGVSDEDLAGYRLLYRDAHTYAVGHGCSVQWECDGEPSEARIWTTFAPEYELLLADSNPDVDAVPIRRLTTDEPTAVRTRLEEFIGGYASWTKERRAGIADLPEHLREAARTHVIACERAVERMRAGVSVLGSDSVAWRAFTLANRAMAAQMARNSWLREGRPQAGPDEAAPAWYPFQLAFFLLCVKGIVEDDSEDRGIADLLWFPTGGGKTEAYLGLIAFVVFLRRLRSGRGGVTALMRYTLRLLTLQQFERATALICACERLRREENIGGGEISIGLWVGQDATPNSRVDAKKALKQVAGGADLQTGNPVQLHSCPWCAAPLDYKNYYLNGAKDRLIVACRQRGCDYSTGLPVLLVDDDIYDHRPALLVATVDKFAALPWTEATVALFGVDDSGDPPPELIIQDELHLISGPLGTLAGLYETAVDALCSGAGSRPKVVASTATIRRAKQQGRGLFARVVEQFPPPGLEARDSYFAVEAGRDEKSTRLYVGLTTPGTSHTTLLIRTYAALLQRGLELEVGEEVRDTYWTLLGYFNSLRVLGGALLQLHDDVADRISVLAAGKEKRDIRAIELTSRVPSSNIPAALKQMTLAYPNDHALDVILATNMVSVGMDVDRLGLMVVMGQPQLTAEYIQATSRVGRKHPGLIFTLFNAARSRDRSHYESFVSFHSALYRQVESTSVTPFSPRARDRALHAVVVALARARIPGLRGNDSAVHISDFDSEIGKIVDEVLARIDAVDDTETAASRQQIDEFLERWRRRAASTANFCYRDFDDPTRALLVNAADSTDDLEAEATMWSLRDVDKSSSLYLIG